MRLISAYLCYENANMIAGRGEYARLAVREVVSHSIGFTNDS